MPGAAGLREPFLSALDSRAAVKGSRDALGAGRIWIPLGRQVVGNVNTVAHSVRDYTTTMLGYLLDSPFQGFPVGNPIAWRNRTIRVNDGSPAAGKRIAEKRIHLGLANAGRTRPPAA